MMYDPASITADISDIEGAKLKAIAYAYDNKTISIGIIGRHEHIILKKDFIIEKVKKEIHSVSIVGFNIDEGITIQIIAGSFADDTMEIIELILPLSSEDRNFITSDIALNLLTE